MVHLKSFYSPCDILKMILTATFAFWMCKIMEMQKVAADGTILRRDKDLNSLDYVSLTDHSRGKYSGDFTIEGNNTTWVIGKTSCLNLQPGCMCDFQNSIICSCDDIDQVVNLKGTHKATFSVNETWRWKINGCSKLILQPNFLSAFFESGSGLHLEFNNISKLIIQESAFTLKDSGSFSHGTTVLFNNCDIENVPPRSFPSYLSTVSFMNCKIGILSSHFIQSLKMDTIIFENTSVNDIQSNAFYSNTILDSLIARNSRFKQIRPDAVASAIQELRWSDCIVDYVQKYGLSGHIASVVIEGSSISNLETQGFSVKAWTIISFVNNIFKNVSRFGIDLANVESKIVRPAQLVGNSWSNVDRDFITTGMLEEPFATVQNNTFLNFCSCGSTFTSFLTLNGSRSWFHDELFQSSKCLMDEKGKQCLQSENNTEDGFIAYQELPLLCSPEVFMCMSEVKDIPVSPQLPNRLRILAFLIGAFVLFMVVSLLLTLLVYMIRRKSPRKSETGGHPNELTNDLPRKEFVKSLNTDQYTAVNHNKLPKTPSMPLRVALLEDVEMEDKGVQTLPTELSADIIEGLREKLSKPDSFWDAKETIDHLYDLIHVRDQSALVSSPPDVTVCNDNSEMPTSSNSSAHNISHDSLKLLVSPSRRLPKILPSDKSPRRSMSTFAQVPSPSKSAQICEYRDPSDSQLHIYSELVNCSEHNGRLASELRPPENNKGGASHPIVCEYTEPKDFQTHIYAELSNIPPSSPSKASYTQTCNFNSAMTDIPINEVPALLMQAPPLPTSVIPSSPQNNFDSDSKLNDLSSDPVCKQFSFETSMTPTTNSGSPTMSSNIPNSISVGTNFSPTKRPLPSIPVPSFSAVQ